MVKKRARTKDGRYKGDDPDTKFIDEAYYNHPIKMVTADILQWLYDDRKTVIPIVVVWAILMAFLFWSVGTELPMNPVELNGQD